MCIIEQKPCFNINAFKDLRTSILSVNGHLPLLYLQTSHLHYFLWWTKKSGRWIILCNRNLTGLASQGKLFRRERGESALGTFLLLGIFARGTQELLMGCHSTSCLLLTSPTRLPVRNLSLNSPSCQLGFPWVKEMLSSLFCAGLRLYKAWGAFTQDSILPRT